MTNPTNAYTVPSVSITTARTGASSRANALGMRAICTDNISAAKLPLDLRQFIFCCVHDSPDLPRTRRKSE